MVLHIMDILFEVKALKAINNLYTNHSQVNFLILQ